jgi:hypothetical protein
MNRYDRLMHSRIHSKITACGDVQHIAAHGTEALAAALKLRVTLYPYGEGVKISALDVCRARIALKFQNRAYPKRKFLICKHKITSHTPIFYTSVCVLSTFPPSFLLFGCEIQTFCFVF